MSVGECEQGKKKKNVLDGVANKRPGGVAADVNQALDGTAVADRANHVRVQARARRVDDSEAMRRAPGRVPGLGALELALSKIWWWRDRRREARV